ncbi:MAG TPA: enoyl-CoA hydratase-related protein [Chloroflexota bacterium]|nr:enoyl-CoA hydratase-related protein [Chloroflexota bacterium]
MTTASETAFVHILVDRRGPAGIITINRPRVLNALSHETLQEISSAFDELVADPEVRAIIVTGSGDRAFAAGADIAELQSLATAQEGFEHSKSSHQLLFKMQDAPKPVIMAVNGYALGGGCELALGGDIILASDNARFGQPEVNLGIIPGFGGTQRLPRLVGRTRALEMIFTGDQIKAEEAYRIGLVNRVVPADQLLAVAEEMAARIARKAPLAIAMAKRAVYEGLERSPREGNELEMRYFGDAVATDDRKEGTAAFLEKREPVWQGK